MSFTRKDLAKEGTALFSMKWAVTFVETLLTTAVNAFKSFNLIPSNLDSRRLQLLRCVLSVHIIEGGCSLPGWLRISEPQQTSVLMGMEGL